MDFNQGPRGIACGHPKTCAAAIVDADHAGVDGAGDGFGTRSGGRGQGQDQANGEGSAHGVTILHLRLHGAANKLTLAGGWKWRHRLCRTRKMGTNRKVFETPPASRPTRKEL